MDLLVLCGCSGTFLTTASISLPTSTNGPYKRMGEGVGSSASVHTRVHVLMSRMAMYLEALWWWQSLHQ